jgi:steroid delta-isomerase-like uncharacterized protein
MDAETDHDVDRTAATFAVHRYEVTPTGEVYDGPVAVRAFLQESFTAFPDMRFNIHALHHAPTAVIAEITFIGTHLGNWRGLPATGRLVTYRMCNVFVFDQDRLLCERLYFDLMTALRGAGVARDPRTVTGRLMLFLNHPVTIAVAFIRKGLGVT